MSFVRSFVFQDLFHHFLYLNVLVCKLQTRQVADPIFANDLYYYILPLVKISNKIYCIPIPRLNRDGEVCEERKPGTNPCFPSRIPLHRNSNSCQGKGANFINGKCLNYLRPGRVEFQQVHSVQGGPGSTKK